MTKWPDYENYERLDSFTPEQLERYRSMLLEKTKPQVDFILNRIPKRPLNVLDLGCGNGRVLIQLALRGALNIGTGIDLSSSRIAFADSWKLSVTAPLLRFFTDDISQLPQSVAAIHDLSLCLTGCFQYLYPYDIDAPGKVLSLMRGSKYALFELYRKPTMGRTWKQLPHSDPWEYLLDEYEDVGEWVRHTKTFLNHKHTYGGYAGKDVRVENLAYYEMPEFLSLLHEAGFTNVHWARQNSTTMVVLVS